MVAFSAFWDKMLQYCLSVTTLCEIVCDINTIELLSSVVWTVSYQQGECCVCPMAVPVLTLS